MVTHSSVLAQRIPGTVEPGGLPSMVSHRVRHDLAAAAAAALVLLLKPGEAQLQEYKSIWSITLSALGNKNLKVNGKLQGLDLFHLPNKNYNLISFLV